MIIRFNRHQKFNSEMMEYHSQTLRMVEDFYTEMIPMAKELGWPESIINRIDYTESIINK